MGTMQLVMQIAILCSVLMVKPCSSDSAMYETKYTKRTLEDRRDVIVEALSRKRANLSILCSFICSLNQRCQAFHFGHSSSTCTQYRVVHKTMKPFYFPRDGLYVRIVQQTYIGCYIDARQKRVLNKSMMIDKIRMTTETCKRHCQRKHQPYFGTEYGNECYCGDVIRRGNRPIQDTECSMTCSGDKSQTCGDDLRISVYKIVL